MLRHFYDKLMAVSAQLNALDDLLSNRQDIFDPVLIMDYSNKFLRSSLPLICILIMMITENSYFAEKNFPFEGNEM